MTAEYKVHGNIAVITMNAPPVNGLGLSTRRAIAAGLERAHADADLHEPGVELRVSLHARRMQRHLRATAEREPERRDDDGERHATQGGDELLERPGALLDGLPIASRATRRGK